MDSRRHRIVAAFGSLRLRITVCALAALLVGVSATTFVLVQRAERDTLESARERELAKVAEMAARVSASVVERQRALRASSQQVDAAMLGDVPQLSRYLENKPLLREMFSGVFVADAEGRVLVYADASGVRPLALGLAERDYFQRAMRERRPVISEPLPSRVTGGPAVVFAHPLGGVAASQGVIGGVIELSERDLLADTAGRVNDVDGSLTVIGDVRGRFLTRSMEGALLRPLSAEPRLHEAHTRWVASGAPIEPSGLLLPQAGEIVSAAGVAGPDWMVWRVTPESVLLGPLHAARRHALLLAGALIAGLSLGMLALISWLLRPLGQLADRAQHLFDGSHDIHAGWPDADGEIGRLSRVLRHVGAERAQLESFNAQVLGKLSSVMAAAPVGICFTRGNCFELVSAEFCRLFGRTEADLLGHSVSITYASNEDYLAIAPQVLEAFARGQSYAGEWQMLRADGARFWAQLRGRPVNEGDPSAGTIWSVVDISEQVASREQLEWSATHDALTGLANRKLLDQRLGRVFEARPHSLPAEVVMIDLDHFKPINDRAGHAAGDAMLKAVAAAITSRVRASDLVVRLGGDEFALLLERCTHETALRVAEEVRQAIGAIALHWEGQPLGVGASLGVASLGADTSSAENWLAQADAACYAAKAAGRGSVRAAHRPSLRAVG